MQQAHPGEVGLGRGQARPVEARHQRAGADAQVAREAAHRAQHRCEACQGVEEHADIPGRVLEHRDHARQDSRRHRGRRVGEQIAQPAPAGGLRAVDRGAHPGGAEPQQRLGDFAIVVRDEGDGGDGGKLAHEAGDDRQLLPAAPMHRQDEGIHALPAGGVQRVPQGVGVERREAAVAHGVDTRALRRGADGHHAGRR